MRITIGIPAHNEEKNIGNILDHLLKQQLPSDDEITEIIVVCSGCTDSTSDIVGQYSSRYSSIKLYVEHERNGHASAMNIILKNATGDIVVFGCADTEPTPTTMAHLTAPFKRNSLVGGVVGRAVPLNDPNSLWGYIAHLSYGWNYDPRFLMFDLEGFSAVRREMVGLIPAGAINTERYIDDMIRQRSYSLVFAAEAITYTMQPRNVTDFVNQRRRNLFGHLQQRNYGMPAPHISIRNFFWVVFHSLEASPRKLLFLAIMLILWGFSFALAYSDYLTGASHLKWKPITSGKSLRDSSEPTIQS